MGDGVKKARLVARTKQGPSEDRSLTAPSFDPLTPRVCGVNPETGIGVSLFFDSSPILSGPLLVFHESEPSYLSANFSHACEK